MGIEAVKHTGEKHNPKIWIARLLVAVGALGILATLGDAAFYNIIVVNKSTSQTEQQERENIRIIGLAESGAGVAAGLLLGVKKNRKQGR